MKKFFLCMIIFILVFFPIEGYGEIESLNNLIFIVLNDQLISFQDAYPEIKEGTTYVPVRFFSEDMEAEVRWDSQTESVVITKDGKKILLDLSLRSLFTDEGIIITDCVYINHNQIMVPFKFIAEFFGYEVDYLSRGPIAIAKDGKNQSNDNELYTYLQKDLVKEKKRILLEIQKREREELRLSYKIAYITFDDGPSIYTEKLLDILNDYQAKATFFMLSDRIKTHPEVVKRMIREGNGLGLHGVTHNVKRIYQSSEILVSEMDECNNSLEMVADLRTTLIRVPYGSKPYMTKAHRNAVLVAGYKMWDWNVDSQDSSAKYVSPTIILENIKEQLISKNVPIILLHEKSTSVKALPKILEYLKKQGYVLLPIKEDQKPFTFWDK